ncbi:MAG: MATE family efflux transporter [Actinomycetota bacterium]
MELRLRSPYDRDIARLAIPALGTLVAEPLYVLADTAIVGRIGTQELAGVALATAVLLSVHSLLIFLAYGTTGIISRLIGADDEAAAARVAIQSLWLAALLGVMFSVFLWFTGGWFLRLLGGRGGALEFGQLYLDISLIGLPFLLLALAAGGTFHGRQNTRTPLMIAVTAALANLVIELVLVFGLGFGVGGSAASTVIAQVGAAAVFCWRVIGWAQSRGASLAPVGAELVRLFVAGNPLMLRTLALRGSFTLATAVAARIGEPELAAHQVGLQIWGTLALALDAVAIAGQALTGRFLGAGDGTRAKAAAQRMIEIDVALGVVAGAVILAARPLIARVFTTDPEVIAAITAVLVWVAIAEPVNGYVFALDGVLIGAGDLRYLGRSMAVVALAFGAIVWVTLRFEPSLDRLWAALSVFMVLRAVALWWRWRSDSWVVLGRSRA